MVPPAPGYIQLYPTVRCNQSCFFCFNRPFLSPNRRFSGSGNTPPDLSFRESLRLLEILVDQGIGEIDVMGGEPLLIPWMPDFARKASSGGMKVNISTNGSLPGRLDRFKDSDPGKITMGVSLEGSTGERHDAITGASHFSLTLKSIETLLSLRLNFVVKTVVSRTTVPDIQNIIDLLRRLGITSYYLIHMDVFTEDPAVIKESLSYPDFKTFCDRIRTGNDDMEIFTVSASCFTKELIGSAARCSGGVNKLSVLPDGSVFPCNLFHGFPEFCLGNILRDDFPSIWTSHRLDAFRKTPEDCCHESCFNRNSCTGGCPAHGLYHRGDPHGCDVRCEFSHPDALSS